MFAHWEKSHTEIWNLKESAKANKFPYLFIILTHPKWDRSAPITITWHIPVTRIFKPIVKTLFLDELWNPLENILSNSCQMQMTNSYNFLQSQTRTQIVYIFFSKGIYGHVSYENRTTYFSDSHWTIYVTQKFSTKHNKKSLTSKTSCCWAGGSQQWIQLE